MSFKGEVPRTDECVFHDLLKLCSGQCIRLDVRVFTVEDPTSFHTDTQVEKTRCFAIRK